MIFQPKFSLLLINFPLFTWIKVLFHDFLTELSRLYGPLADILVYELTTGSESNLKLDLIVVGFTIYHCNHFSIMLVVDCIFENHIEYNLKGPLHYFQLCFFLLSWIFIQKKFAYYSNAFRVEWGGCSLVMFRHAWTLEYSRSVILM